MKPKTIPLNINKLIDEIEHNISRKIYINRHFTRTFNCSQSNKYGIWEIQFEKSRFGFYILDHVRWFEKGYVCYRFESWIGWTSLLKLTFCVNKANKMAYNADKED